MAWWLSQAKADQSRTWHEAHWLPSAACAFWVLSPTPWMGCESWLAQQAALLCTPSWEHSRPHRTGPAQFQLRSRPFLHMPPCLSSFSLSLLRPPGFFRVWEPSDTKKRDFIKLYTLTVSNLYLLSPNGALWCTAWGSGSEVKLPGFKSQPCRVSGYWVSSLLK